MIEHERREVMNYYVSRTVDYPFEQALVRVTEELKKEGFGVLTQIDVKATLRQKLGVDFSKYQILGACNPTFAYKALQNERMIGTMLPCNVIVQEVEKGKTEVAAVDPIASMQAVNNPALVEIATQVQEKLKRVIENV
jgi:uncharacterized protein (DUF302 family)